MSNKTRKRIWPASLVMSIAIIGALAAFLVLAGNPGPTSAHAPGEHPGIQSGAGCADLTVGNRAIHDGVHAQIGAHGTMDPCPTGTGGNGGTTPDPMPGDVSVTSSSTSGSATVELKLTIKVKQVVPVGGAIVLYLEDDFQEPESISASDVYFVVTPADPNDDDRVVQTGSGSRVYATQNPEIDTDGHFTADKDDIDIRVSLPDLCTSDTVKCEGRDGLMRDDTVTMVFQKSAGIKNPSEAGTHSVGASVLGPADNVGGPMYQGDNVDILNGDGDKIGTGTLSTVAKIGISDPDNSRGYEMTVTGSGFNDGTTAAVYVLAHARFEVAKWWETLDCPGMKAALGTDSDNACFHFDLDSTNMSYMLNTSDGMRGGSTSFKALSDADKKKYSDMVFTQHLCRTIIQDGTEVGGALVDTNDKVEVKFEVTAPTFKPGNVNYICMVDGEGRMSDTDVEDFNLEPSIKVVPSEVNSGDTVNVFAQDFQNNGVGFHQLKIASRVIQASAVSSSRNIGADGSGEVTFKVPGGLEGVLRIDAQWGANDGDPAKCDIDAPNRCISEDSKITIAGADLSVSKTDALPNETLTVTGNGFASQSCIPVANVTLDDVAVMVDEDSLGGNCASNEIEVSNSGQFVATIILWPATGRKGGPTLIAGTHELSVEDDDNFSASVDITIAEPTVKVTPDVAGPPDYITITGENWPVDNPDGSVSPSITIEVADNRNSRTYTVFADGVGRVTQEHRVHRNVSIPSDVQIKMTYEDVSKIGSFSVPASTIEVSPGEGQPGDTITLTAANMKVYTEVDSVSIGGSTQDNPGVNTDRDGNVTVEDVLIPGLDPGVYSVVINVDGTIAIGELTVLAESSAAGAPAALPGAVESLGDSLVAIFHFDDVGKVWSFHDPRPEFAELNTLTEMVNGEAYWILVNESVDEAILNNKVRSLTCRGDDCWNLEVW